MCKVPKLCLTHCFLVPASPVGLSSTDCSLGNVAVKLILSNTLGGVVPGTLAEKSILGQVMNDLVPVLTQIYVKKTLVKMNSDHAPYSLKVAPAREQLTVEAGCEIPRTSLQKIAQSAEKCRFSTSQRTWLELTSLMGSWNGLRRWWPSRHGNLKRLVQQFKCG